MTTLSRWDPIREMQALHTQFNNIFQPFARFATLAEDMPASTWMPSVDIEESGDALFLRAEIPGMDPKDIDVSFENGVLTIKGERRFENKRNDRQFHLVERSYGSFTRSFTLPRSVDPDRVKARYENGILELEMPKREETKPRRIPLAVSTESQKQIEK